ncbi:MULTISPECIES: XdhC family protein [Methylophaga]|uniref:XdhC family protein n=1 Tax=Methylophaga TaxID=40222 RepID=UPI00235669F1|nr:MULTISPECIES: XdhC family protein [Methylophaga]
MSYRYVISSSHSRMTGHDLNVLRQLLSWQQEGHKVWLITVVGTYGSSPRQPGSMCALRSDGLLLGSVSGGCIEDDLVSLVKQHQLSTSSAEIKIYGANQEEQLRYKLPCGGQLRLLIEPVLDRTWLEAVVTAIESQKLIKRQVTLDSLQVTCAHAISHEPVVSEQEGSLSFVYGPRLRLLIIGAAETSFYLANMATALDYQVFVCDPRPEMQETWQHEQSTLLTMMPDDAVVSLQPDLNTAVVALTHDPKLDDMALLEALKSAAFYVGALGAKTNNDKRRERLQLFDLTQQEIDRLHGPVGLQIGSKTPAEIAVAISAELIAVRRDRIHTPQLTSSVDKVTV